ncbi:hypothetical protein D3C71_1495480 [compost metagenome]
MIGTVAATVVAISVMTGQRLVSLGQGFEHPLATGNVGLVDIRRHGIDPEGIERVPLGRHQVPATITLFRAEKAAGLEGRAFV